MEQQDPLTRIESFKDLGFANVWTNLPDEVKQCQALQHNHLQLKLEGNLHRICCPMCEFKFTEDGMAPLLPRVVMGPAIPEASNPAPALDEERIVKMAVTAALAALDAREQVKDTRKAPEVHMML